MTTYIRPGASARTREYAALADAEGNTMTDGIARKSMRGVVYNTVAIIVVAVLVVGLIITTGFSMSKLYGDTGELQSVQMKGPSSAETFAAQDVNITRTVHLPANGVYFGDHYHLEATADGGVQFGALDHVVLVE